MEQEARAGEAPGKVLEGEVVREKKLNAKSNDLKRERER
jgi:hypothetical protein